MKKSDKNTYLQTGSNELYKKIHLLLNIFGTQEEVYTLFGKFI